jgi:hypothetical protein
VDDTGAATLAGAKDGAEDGYNDGFRDGKRDAEALLGKGGGFANSSSQLDPTENVQEGGGFKIPAGASTAYRNAYIAAYKAAYDSAYQRGYIDGKFAVNSRLPPDEEEEPGPSDEAENGVDWPNNTTSDEGDPALKAKGSPFTDYSDTYGPDGLPPPPAPLSSPEYGFPIKYDPQVAGGQVAAAEAALRKRAWKPRRRTRGLLAKIKEQTIFG